MIKFEKFESSEKAFSKMLEKNKKYSIIRHELKLGEEIKEHSHEDANEFVIFITGYFLVSCDDETKKFDLKNDVHVVFFPKNSKHYLKNLGEKLNYFVIRDTAE